MTRPLLRAAPALTRPGLLGGLSTRVGFPAAAAAGGEDTRAASRRILARALGRTTDDLVWLKQVHGATVLQVRAPGFQGEADALVSDSRRWILLISVADCCPVLFWSERAGVFGAAHAGWRGCVAGVVPATVEALVGLGAESASLHAWLGPCIGPERFEVGGEVAARFDDAHVVRGDSPKPHVDLRSALRAQLEACGLDPRRILSTEDCTFSRRELYWSYRRDGGIEGRHLAYLAPGP